MSNNLFSPLQLGALTLPNRMVMAPMTRNRAPDTIPNTLMAEYYVQRATAGLIVTEGSQISPQGVGYPATPGIHSKEQIAGWKTVTDAVHAKGGRIFLQLWHVGRISHPSLQPGNAAPVSASTIRPNGETFTGQGMQPFETPRALETEEIAAVVRQYAAGAANAKAAGFDGVEIHGANGYLIDQFLRDGSNRRNDRYGGAIENRCRFMLEVTEAVCGAWSADRVGIRLAPLNPFNDMHDSDPRATFTHAVKELNRFGLAYLHITEMGKDAPGAAGPAFDLTELRKLWQGTYITNAGYDRARAEAAISEGRADAVAFGVPFLANPDLVARFRQDAALNAPDVATFYGGDGHGYTDYPALGEAIA
ncbi:MAG TPA: alkene reductase [Mariprofundaceae bacterium]|nr:alkene reductase [Mariprofundaceae bacterium]